MYLITYVEMLRVSRIVLRVVEVVPSRDPALACHTAKEKAASVSPCKDTD